MNQLTTVESRADASRAHAFTPAIDPSCIMMPSYTEALVDPGGVFLDPGEVVEHPWFTHEEKRTILLSWVRDELLLEQVANGTLPELKPKSRIDAVIEALSCFDPSAAAEYCTAVASIRAKHLRRLSGAGGLKRMAKVKNP